MAKQARTAKAIPSEFVSELLADTQTQLADLRAQLLANTEELLAIRTRSMHLARLRARAEAKRAQLVDRHKKLDEFRFALVGWAPLGSGDGDSEAAQPTTKGEML